MQGMTLGFPGVAALAIAMVGCGRTPEMRAASVGDAATLSRIIADKEKAGTLTNRAAAELARAVADREVRTSSGPEAVAIVEDVRSCARDLDDAMIARMSVHDAGGAAAALARLESGALGTDSVRPSFSDSAGPWRAVGARGLVRQADREARQRAFADSDPEVRRWAIRAARDAKDLSDLAALAEAARRDPEHSIRTEAVRALGALPSPPTNRDVANALRDLWTSSDEALRQDIALAWATPEQWLAGGREALGFVINTGKGLDSIEAAEAVLRHPDVGQDLQTEAVARLVEQIGDGSRAERLHALAVTPVDPVRCSRR